MPFQTVPPAQRSPLHRLRPLAGLSALAAALLTGQTWAQSVPNFPITPGQRATANQVAEAGVPLSELAPNAPDSYTIKRGDTLWAISGVFLKSPWRWPELWGMNLQDIRNPHLIFPNQVLYLIKANGRATLSTRGPGGDIETVKVSPRIRSEGLSDSAVPPISLQAIEAFLTSSLIVDETTLARAPRIVATPETRVLLSRGDRAYARGAYSSGEPGEPLSMDEGKPRDFRVFRNATPLKDPTTGQILGYEAQYLGKAQLERGETSRQMADADGKVQTELIPATIDIVAAKEEMRVGDRMLPEPERLLSNYVPSAPSGVQTGQIVSVGQGNAVTFAAQNQVVVINRGKVDGIERGHVLALLRETSTLTDKTDDARPTLRLPGERNGLMMVFQTFDRLSYALVLDIRDGVKVGDRFTNP
ncbi:LysM peptidoglycan-binding domain-containing protein [Hydrogenophaga sp.]|uniref:LysM peptidoglycan-binding domain-containing protein n=1 Tax=Hydrogenophaga sp. TaxID=1904254 RepID=UPI0025B8E928|nr:LysM peptidoglycan-binding domain-containing protein [Hydrogenophaga sp.]